MLRHERMSVAMALAEKLHHFEGARRETAATSRRGAASGKIHLHNASQFVETFVLVQILDHEVSQLVDCDCALARREGSGDADRSAPEFVP